MTLSPQRGCRVLVVEDEALIASLIEDILHDIDCEVIGPVGKLDAAMQLAREAELDAAILDVTIRGGQVFPVAEILAARGVPFVLASGYGDWALPEALRGNMRLMKPFDSEELTAAIRTMCKPR